MKNIIENLLKLQTFELSGATGAETEKLRAELRAKIPAPILGHYDRLRARGKKGVTVIRNLVCSGCHMQVPRNTELTLMHGTDIQLCESCGCYLCLPEHISPALPPVKTKKPRSKPAAVLLQIT
jgi:predicted  nucleic acid-binding Zn-ribbon protein